MLAIPPYQNLTKKITNFENFITCTKIILPWETYRKVDKSDNVSSDLFITMRFVIFIRTHADIISHYLARTY